MKDISILVVDDEKPARNKLISFLNESGNDFTICEAANGIEAIEKINKINPDLVFLDIQMPGAGGFDVIKNIGAENMPAVIFVTAFDQYALDAFEINAVDYLLKPFDKNRFQKSLNRALKKIHSRKGNKNELNKLLEELRKGKKYSERFLVNQGSKYFFVNTSEINYISAEEKYAELNTSKGKFLLRNTMTNLEAELDPVKFARVHRSFIVNIEQIQEIQPWSHGDSIIILKNGEKLSFSRRYRDNVFNKS
jgi:two-component system, LytTR family, response regulator